MNRHSEATKADAERLWTLLHKPQWKLQPIADAIQTAEDRGRQSAVEVLELMRAHERVPSHVVLLLCAEGSIKGVK